jgi:hypothetical protein
MRDFRFSRRFTGSFSGKPANIWNNIQITNSKTKAMNPTEVIKNHEDVYLLN